MMPATAQRCFGCAVAPVRVAGSDGGLTTSDLGLAVPLVTSTVVGACLAEEFVSNAQTGLSNTAGAQFLVFDLTTTGLFPLLCSVFVVAVVDLRSQVDSLCLA